MILDTLECHFNKKPVNQKDGEHAFFAQFPIWRLRAWCGQTNFFLLEMTQKLFFPGEDFHILGSQKIFYGHGGALLDPGGLLLYFREEKEYY